MIIENIVVGEFACNCTIIACEETKEALIIDPGDEPQKIIEVLDKYDLKPKYLIHTHAHLDHIMATRDIKEKTQAEIFLHKADLTIYKNLNLQALKFGMTVKDPLDVDKFIEDGELITIGENITCKIIHTPGHSPGGVCFYFSNFEKPVVFSGDTLFAGSIGRTDLWEGSYDDLIKSIKNRLFTLDDETIVCPGHGNNTTIGKEKKTNPFFV